MIQILKWIILALALSYMFYYHITRYKSYKKRQIYFEIPCTCDFSEINRYIFSLLKKVNIPKYQLKKMIFKEYKLIIYSDKESYDKICEQMATINELKSIEYKS